MPLSREQAGALDPASWPRARGQWSRAVPACSDCSAGPPGIARGLTHITARSRGSRRRRHSPSRCCASGSIPRRARLRASKAFRETSPRAAGGCGCVAPGRAARSDRAGSPSGSPRVSASRVRRARFGSVMQDSFDATTLIFLALAVFVIWRLRSVLGQKTGTERSPFRPVERNRTETPGNRSEATMSCACPVPIAASPLRRRARHRATGAASPSRVRRSPAAWSRSFRSSPPSIRGPSWRRQGRLRGHRHGLRHGDRKTLRRFCRGRSARASSGRSPSVRSAARPPRPPSSRSTRPRSSPSRSGTGSRRSPCASSRTHHRHARRRGQGDRRQCRDRRRGARRVDLRPHARRARSELAARRHRRGRLIPSRRDVVPTRSPSGRSGLRRCGPFRSARPRGGTRACGDGVLEPVAFSALAGWREDDAAAASTPSAVPAPRRGRTRPRPRTSPATRPTSPPPARRRPTCPRTRPRRSSRRGSRPTGSCGRPPAPSPNGAWAS